MLQATDENYVAHYLLGSELLKRRQFDEALANNRQAVEVEPRSARAHFYLGVTLQTLQHADEAAKEYQTSLALNEHYFLAHLNLGAIFLSRRQHADAKREFERAAELEKDDGRAVANLAVVALEVGDDPQAIAHAQRALPKTPKRDSCWNAWSPAKVLDRKARVPLFRLVDAPEEAT
jgi:Flp pilus assembly protein TadD